MPKLFSTVIITLQDDTTLTNNKHIKIKFTREAVAGKSASASWLLPGTFLSKEISRQMTVRNFPCFRLHVLYEVTKLLSNFFPTLVLMV